MKREVIVVGAGPAGGTAAYYLAKAGVDVLLVDKETWPRDKPCGDGLRGPSWPLFREMGVMDDIMKYGTPSKGTLLVSATEKSIGLRSKPHGVISCPRKIVDHLVVQAAIKAGAEFLQNFEALDLVVRRGVVRGVRAVFEGQIIEVESDLVIVADGAHSRLAHQIGFYNEDPDLVFYGARGYFEGIREMTDMIEFFYFDMFAPSGYTWIFPMSKTKGNVGVFITEGALQRSGMVLNDLFDWWRDNTKFGNIRLGEARLLGEIKGWRLPSTWAVRENYSHGVMVAGDAGNMIEAAFGGGQDLAMLAGQAAAETAIEALKQKDYSAEALAPYKQKLLERQTPIYNGYNAARKFLFTNTPDLDRFIDRFAEEAASRDLGFDEALGRFLRG